MTTFNSIREDALRYLGFKKSKFHLVDSETLDNINESIVKIDSLASFKYTYKVFDIEVCNDTINILDSEISFNSSSLNVFLKNKSKAVFFAATMGIATDKLISSVSSESISKGLIYDAVASAFLETKCDEAQFSINSDELTTDKSILRFSPGYGDLDLGANGVILDLIQAHKQIGLTTSPNQLLFPQKSIVAIFHTSTMVQNNHDKCLKCTFSQECGYKLTEKDFFQ